MEKSKGQIAYEAYMESLFDNTYVFAPWEHIKEESKESWEVAANAVVDAVLAE